MKILGLIFVGSLIMLNSARAVLMENFEIPVVIQEGKTFENEVEMVSDLSSGQSLEDNTEERISQEELESKVEEIQNKIKQFYGVKDLSQLGEYGKHLKELLDRLITESPSSLPFSPIQDIRIREVYKNGTYALELSWREENIGASIGYKLRFEGILARDGKISPTDLVVKEDVEYVTWPPSGVKRTHTFSFGPNGITDEEKKEEKWRDRIWNQ